MLEYFEPEMINANLINGQIGTYINGEWISSFAASVPVRIIAPQPVTSNELQMMPNGEDGRDYLKTYSETKIFIRESGEDSDKIIFNGFEYKIVQVDDRTILGNFYRIIMRKIT